MSISYITNTTLYVSSHTHTSGDYALYAPILRPAEKPRSPNPQLWLSARARMNDRDVITMSPIVRTVNRRPVRRCSAAA